MAIGCAGLLFIQMKTVEDIVGGFLGGQKDFSRNWPILQNQASLVLVTVAKHRLWPL